MNLISCSAGGRHKGTPAPQHACARAKAQVGIAPIAPVPKHLFHGKQFSSRARVSFLLKRKVTVTPVTAGNVVFHNDMSTPETLDSQHELHLGAPPVLKYCTSCRHYRDAYFAFTIGRKTCRDCCEKHRVYQAEKRKAEKKNNSNNPRDTRSPKESVSKQQTFWKYMSQWVPFKNIFSTLNRCLRENQGLLMVICVTCKALKREVFISILLIGGHAGAVVFSIFA